MKEATGELSTTVITVVAIAAISSLFIAVLYPRLKNNIILSQACSNGPSYKDENVTCTGITTDTEGGNSNISKVCGDLNSGNGGQWVCSINEQ